jgi:hypothetical protein
MEIDWVELPHGNDQTPNTSFTVWATIHLTNLVPHKIISHFTNTTHFYTSKFLTQKNLVPHLNTPYFNCQKGIWIKGTELSWNKCDVVTLDQNAS